ncbi:DUF7604 domain-containing protein [Streptococcus cameli]
MSKIKHLSSLVLLLLFLVSLILGNVGTVFAEGPPSFAQNKQIDYLGDGVDNPDTDVDTNGTDTKDLYRLYLDMTGTQEPFDTLIVVDRSTSMNKVMSRTDTRNRSQAVFNTLSGTNGLLSKLAEIHPDNQFAIIDLKGYSIRNNPRDAAPDSTIIQDWGRNTYISYNSVRYENDNGTNYSAAFVRAKEMLEANRSGHKKIIIFISDGTPTYYYDRSNIAYVKTSSTLFESWNAVPVSNFKSNGNFYRLGDGTLETGYIYNPNSNTYNSHSNGDVSREGTNALFDTYFKNYFVTNDIPMYTIGLSEEFATAGETYGIQNLKYLSSATDGKYFPAKDTANLEQTLQEIVNATKLSLVSINDELSQYVDYYQEKPDVKVTRTNRKTQAIETLYENGGVTQVGANVIESVTHTPINRADSTGKVDLNFKPGVYIDDQYTYTLSYNIKVNQTAYTQYANARNQYDATGDANTDFADNRTSSNQLGFRSNKEASLSYTRKGVTNSSYYPHPVVQVHETTVPIRKIDLRHQTPLAEVGFELRKQDGTVVSSGKTNVDGQLVLEHLVKGQSYELHEVSSLEDYIAPAAPWRVTIEETGVIRLYDQNGTEILRPDATGAFTVTNEKKLELPLVKVDANNRLARLSGVQFELRHQDNSVMATGTTKDGLLTFKGLLRNQTYYLYETQALPGYTLPERPWTITVANDWTITITDQVGQQVTLSQLGDTEAFELVNHHTYQLPATGGTGSYPFIFIGSTIFSTVALLYFRRKNHYF